MTGWLPSIAVVLWAVALIAWLNHKIGPRSRLARRLRRVEARPGGMGRHEVAASLRPRGGHVEAAPIEAPALITTNGKAEGEWQS